MKSTFLDPIGIDGGILVAAPCRTWEATGMTYRSGH